MANPPPCTRAPQGHGSATGERSRPRSSYQKVLATSSNDGRTEGQGTLVDAAPDQQDQIAQPGEPRMSTL